MDNILYLDFSPLCLTETSDGCDYDVSHLLLSFCPYHDDLVLLW